METRRLYYENCHLFEFTARVLGCTQEDAAYQVVLDATAFYPEGGGQAWDLGTLGDARVLAVREKDGVIFHQCDKPLEAGTAVRGLVDRERRLDLAQQHSGEHIVSGLLHSRFGYHNVGFHVGAQVMEVDFDGPLTPEDIAWVEWEANRAVWRDLPVKCWYPTPEELPHVPYRSKKALPWPVRVVRIGDVDSCACCGVHVAATGEIGVIKILTCVKFHQGVRLEMVCGGRALEHIGAVYAQNRQVSQLLSAKMLETGDAARRLKDALAAEKFRAAGLEKRLFQAIAKGYAGEALAVHFEPELSGGSLRELAQAIQAQGAGLTAVFSGGDGNYSFCLLGQEAVVTPLNRAMTQALHGRGGGRQGACQGSLAATKQEILDFFARKKEKI